MYMNLFNLILRYILMGLALNTGYAIAMTIWFGQKVKWDDEAMEDILCILTQNPNWKKLNNFLFSKEGRPILIKATILSYAAWPMNIATGLSRIPEIKEYINERN